MSFESFDRGSRDSRSAYTAPRAGGRDGDSEYIRLSSQAEKMINELNTSVVNLQKMVALMGTPRDTPDLQRAFKQQQDGIRRKAAEVEQAVRQLGQMDGGSAGEARTRRMQQEVLAKRFHGALGQFKQCCQLAMTKERANIDTERTRAASFKEDRRPLDRQPLSSDHMQMEQMHFNQAMIREREEGMKEIEATMSEVNDIFRDLATLVHDQGHQLDSIESNMTSADTHVEKGAGELVKASDYQKKARNKMLCLLVIVAIVAAILIIVLVTQLKK